MYKIDRVRKIATFKTCKIVKNSVHRGVVGIALLGSVAPIHLRGGVALETIDD